MTNNLYLEAILELLSAYGRPNLHQYALSANPGRKSAGEWGCEVNIESAKDDELSEVDRAEMYRTRQFLGARCIGTSYDPREAALECLKKCEQEMEGPRAKYLKPKDVDFIKRQEAQKLADRKFDP